MHLWAYSLTTLLQSWLSFEARFDEHANFTHWSQISHKLHMIHSLNNVDTHCVWASTCVYECIIHAWTCIHKHMYCFVCYVCSHGPHKRWCICHCHHVLAMVIVLHMHQPQCMATWIALCTWISKRRVGGWMRAVCACTHACVHVCVCVCVHLQRTIFPGPCWVSTQQLFTAITTILCGFLAWLLTNTHL